MKMIKNSWYPLLLIFISNLNVFLPIYGQGPLRQVTNTLRRLVDKLPFDREIESSLSQNVIREGYPIEEHYTVTEDGYILSLHRIPCSRNCTTGRGRGQPVLLVHGLTNTARVWTLSGREQGLGFVLADAGYDVWMGNLRGTEFSKGHLTYTVNPRSPFWDFSWHEMGIFDIPAFIEFIYCKKGDEGYVSENPHNILIVTHSLGGTAAFVLFSVRPEYNDRVAAVFNLGPLGYTKFMTSPVRLAGVAALFPIEDVLFLLRGNEVIMDDILTKAILQLVCSIPPAGNKLCEFLLISATGYNPREFNTTLLPRIFNKLPAGASSKSFLHYAQCIISGGGFRYFDYGFLGNLRAYGQITPPVYDLTKITVPMANYFGTKDLYGDPLDIIKLDSEIPGSIGPIAVPFQHLDFLWRKDVASIVYKPMIEIMRNYP